MELVKWLLEVGCCGLVAFYLRLAPELSERLAAGCTHRRVEPGSSVSADVLRGCRETPCGLAGADATGAAKAEMASQPAIRGLGKTPSTMKICDDRSPGLSKIARDPAGGPQILLLAAPPRAANSFHAALLVSALGYLNSLGSRAETGGYAKPKQGLGPALRRGKEGWSLPTRRRLLAGASSPALSSRAPAEGVGRSSGVFGLHASVPSAFVPVQKRAEHFPLEVSA